MSLPRGFAHHNARDTEQAAAEDVLARAPQVAERIGKLYSDQPEGLTDWEATEVYAHVHGGGLEDKNLVSSARCRLMQAGYIVEARRPDGTKIQRASRFGKRNQVWRHIRGYEQPIPLPDVRGARPCPHLHLQPTVTELISGDWVALCADCNQVWKRAPRKDNT